MTKGTRVLIILHLCLAFTYLFWLGGQPYLKKYVARKSETALFQGLLARPHYFEFLSSEDQKMVQEGAKVEHTSPSYRHELAQLFLYKRHGGANGFALGWIVFSVVLGVLLLLRIEGAALTAWILPFLVLAYGIAVFKAPPPSPKSTLYPSETIILEDYLDTPKSARLKDKRKDLLRGWQRYLVLEWAKERPSEDPILFETQVEKGEYLFNVVRAKRLMHGEESLPFVMALEAPPSSLLLLLYFAWNLFFAAFVNRKACFNSAPLSSQS